MPARNSRRLGQKQNVDEQLYAQKDKFKLKFIDTYIGYGVFSNTLLNPGELLLEYSGDLAIASTKKNVVESNGFTFYFKHCDKQYSIDASRTDCLAKMVNDQIPSKTNCKMKKMVLDGKPRLLLYATKNIKCGEELRYDYGVGDLPWRRQHEKDVKPELFRHPDPDQNNPLASDGTSATISKGEEDHCPVTSEPSKPCLTEDPNDYPESSATETKDPDQNNPLASDGTSATISKGEEDHCPVTSEPSKPCLTEDPNDDPESSATVTKDPDKNHPLASYGTPSTISEGEEDHCPVTSEPSTCLTEDPNDYPESSATVTKDPDQNHPLASDGTPATISEGEEDHCPVTSEPSKPCLTEDPNDDPESSETVTKDPDQNNPLASDGTSATISKGEEDHCPVTSEPSKPCLTEDPNDYPESSATETKDPDQNNPLASDGTSATISKGEEDHCPVTSEPSKPCLTEDPNDHPESSATVTKDPDQNHPLASYGTSATISKGEEDHCPVTSEPSKPCLTEDPNDYPESSATVTKDPDQNNPLASYGTSATISKGEEDHCPVTSEPSKPCLTEDPNDHPESSATVTKDPDQNHPLASYGTSATISKGEEDHCPVTSEPSKPCLTEDPNDYPESSATERSEVEDDFDLDFNEDLDDSFNDPDFKITDSDEQSSDEYNDNDQGQENNNEYVSDSADESDVIPCEKSLPALQVNKITSSKSQPSAQQVNEAATSRSQQHPPSSIIIQGTNNSKDKRVWDKFHFCFYCKSKFTNITKHYLGPHRNEPEVKMILEHPKKSKERSLGLLKLRNAGDFQNNMAVLKNGKGTLITWARPDKESTTYKDYLPCEDCRAFFLRSNLWRHRQTCPFITTKTKNQKVQAQAQLLIPTSEKVSSGLKENVFSIMTCDEVSIAVRNDSIIVAVGEKLFRKHGHLPHLNTYVSQKMRELGRFLIKVREIDPKITSMKCVMTPEKYPVAVKATRLLCKYKEDTNKYSNPSLALKLGHLLKKCAKIQKSSSLIECDSEKGRKADEFLSLVEAEWTDDISSSALQTLASQKMNKGDMLPISEDILKLQTYFNDKTKKITDQLETTFSKTGWDELNQMTLARVVLFNRRRGGETERVTLEAYDKRLSKSNIVREVELALSPVEKMLCSTFERIEIRGKKGRTVPVLLTPEILKCIDLLLKWRKEANVDQNNPFLFPRPNNSLQALRTTDVLRKFARLANLKYPNNLTSTKLRKHVATVSQILNLSKNDLEVMANFMGHDIEIHRSFYRIPQETLQVALMGKLLSAFDRGTISKYSGKSLEDITLDEELSSEDECEDDVLSKDDTSVQDETDAPGLVEDVTDDPGLVRVSRSKLTPKRPALEIECNLLAKRARNQDISKDSCPGTSSSVNPTLRKSSISLKQARRIQHLTEEQSRCLRSLFQANVTMRRELRRIDCINAIQKHKCLSSLDWTKIKNTVHNWITREKRKIKRISK